MLSSGLSTVGCTGCNTALVLVRLQSNIHVDTQLAAGNAGTHTDISCSHRYDSMVLPSSSMQSTYELLALAPCCLQIRLWLASQALINPELDTLT